MCNIFIIGYDRFETTVCIPSLVPSPSIKRFKIMKQHSEQKKSSPDGVLLIWSVQSDINGPDLTIINSVYQNSCLVFSTAVVIKTSRYN
jgi:hypothetical protein